jgi:acylphosphatase
VERRKDSGSTSGMQHLRVTYRGRVQGVGFRWTVKALADSLSLVGWVRNEPDGTVLLTVLGDRNRLANLLDGIDSKFAGYITEKRVQESGDLQVESSFEIRR